MILYKEWGLHIRLGNWLYNLAAILTIAKKTGHEISLPEYHMWPYMKHPPKIDSGLPYDEPIFHFRTNTWSREEQDWLYTFFGENQDKSININLGPNNQSEKWFEDEKEYVMEMLRFSPTAIADICKKYKHVLGNGKKTIGIGIRRGDFVGHGVFYQIPETWYEKALHHFFPDHGEYNILIFSDDIDWCKQYFSGKPYFFAEPNGTHTHAENFKYYHQNPMEQFVLGTLCNHFIGGNSTFSWWQMWYVKNFNNGRVIHSGKNLSEAGEKEFGVNRDFYSPSWEIFSI